MNININGQSIIAFFRGKKTYMVAASAVVYFVGINHGWWPHEADIDYILAGCGLASTRAALQKLEDSLNGSTAATATDTSATNVTPIK